MSPYWEQSFCNPHQRDLRHQRLGSTALDKLRSNIEFPQLKLTGKSEVCCFVYVKLGKTFLGDIGNLTPCSLSFGLLCN